MKKVFKAAYAALCAALVFALSCFAAFASNGSIATSESNGTVIIFAVVVGVLAAGGAAYFIIMNIRKK